ncbi:RuBisCO transcriptional regulator (plasmid) [Peptoclostridium acidaminophilum DSM 3953]|uniref:RuBisCO transcriptional regulator n=1 Tax=Peptoclostridium acidaminophilum DSM 3953 TaxID=1286171 RepID=W8T780_PEPAC|nr:LysR family transcriptional regulator [Peptoclostridium acidaminophilum]AHM57589.1 RuBisCO transcriptional regulator [Peptoclostridium acidaminophilum DSM 3953]
MGTRHLRIFACVCSEGSMSGAAKKLFMAQPSVSQAIMELERHYGVVLFERLGRRLYITAAGKKLLDYAHHIINLQEEVEREMRDISSKGAIRVGASMTVGSCILLDLLKRFKEAGPGSSVESVVDNTSVIEEMLLLDQVDIGVVEGAVHSADLTVKPFMDDELVLICPSCHPWAAKGAVGPGELEKVEFIVREQGSGTRELFESVMAAEGIKWRRTGVYNNAETIKNAVASGLGVSVVSKMAVERELESGMLVSVKIRDISFKRKFSIVYHKNKFISEAMKLFMQECI